VKGAGRVIPFQSRCREWCTRSLFYQVHFQIYDLRQCIARIPLANSCFTMILACFPSRQIELPEIRVCHRRIGVCTLKPAAALHNNQATTVNHHKSIKTDRAASSKQRLHYLSLQPPERVQRRATAPCRTFAPNAHPAAGKCCATRLFQAAHGGQTIQDPRMLNISYAKQDVLISGMTCSRTYKDLLQRARYAFHSGPLLTRQAHRCCLCHSSTPTGLVFCGIAAAAAG
jgi:hypothetical protein